MKVPLDKGGYFVQIPIKGLTKIHYKQLATH
jgi:hypothetical protein